MQNYENFTASTSIRIFDLSFVRPDNSVAHRMDVKDHDVVGAVSYAQSLCRGTTLRAYQTASL